MSRVMKPVPASRPAPEPAAPPPHPLAGTTMSGADMIVQVLADEGVDTIFGYSGGAILPTYDADLPLQREPPEATRRSASIVPATEQGAGFMAAGYARSSGRVGVFLVTSGPGATNSVTPVRDCQADSIPVVLIRGQVPRAAMGTDAFQEAPVFNIMAPCAKHVFLAHRRDQGRGDDAHAPSTSRAAAGRARSWSTSRRTCSSPSGVFQGGGLLHAARLRRAHRRARARRASRRPTREAFFRLLAQRRAAAHLRRRRRHQQRRGAPSCAPSPSASASRS